MLERVLLTIIKAHMPAEAEGQEYERLSIAMTALLGSADTKACDTRLSAALDWMVRERRRDVCDPDMKAWCDVGKAGVRSTQDLAMIAAVEFLDEGGDMHATAERLCTLFKARCSTVSSFGYDIEREALESEAIERLCAELAEWDVPTRL